MNTIFRVSGSLFLVIALSGCGASNRNIITKYINGQQITCVEPPPDVVLAEGKGSIEAASSQVSKIISGSASYEQKYQRIRSEIPNLQLLETLDFRYCLEYSNGVLTKERYSELIQLFNDLKHDPSLVKNNSKSSQYPADITPIEIGFDQPFYNNIAGLTLGLSAIKSDYSADIYLTLPSKGKSEIKDISSGKSWSFSKDSIAYILTITEVNPIKQTITVTLEKK
jgi:hypothetical protein